MRGLASWLATAVVCGVAAGCPAPPARPLERPAEARVAAYTDSSPVHALAAASPFLLVGTGAGLLRWDLRGGHPEPLLPAELAPARGVHAIALIEDGRAALVPTAFGLGRVDIGKGELTRLAEAPAGQLTADIRSLVSVDGEVWLGGPAGLQRVAADGSWSPQVLSTPVEVLWAGPRGELLVGGPGGLARRLEGEAFTALDAASGVSLASVSFIVNGPDGNPVIIGAGSDGSTRVVVRQSGVFVTYRMAPSFPVVAAASRGRSILLASPQRLYQLVLRQDVRAPLVRDGSRLAPVGPGPRAPFLVLPAPASLPAGVTSLAASGDDIFAGTSAIGTATWRAGAKRPRWLRTSDLATDGELTLGCAAKMCFLATGDGVLWRYDGTFSHAPLPSSEAQVLAVTDGGPGEGPWVIWRDGEGVFAGQRDAESGEPSERVLPVLVFSASTRVLFARVGGGALWMGALEPDGQVALVRTSLSDEDPDWVAPQKELGGLVDLEVGRGDTVWLLGERGVARLGGKVEDVSTLVGSPRALSTTAGGLLAVVGSRGVAVREASGWTAVSGAPGGYDLGVDRKGRLWVATRTGLMVRAGGRFQRLETRAGVLTEPITHLARDRKGRLWTASSQGLGIVEP